MNAKPITDKTQKKYDLSFDLSHAFLLSFSRVSVENKYSCGVVKTKPCKIRFKRIDCAAGVMWDCRVHTSMPEKTPHKAVSSVPRARKTL